MFELIVLAVFMLLFVGTLRLAFRVAWGMAKIIAVILFVLALPILIGALLLASGFMLLIPVVLVAVAFGILRACL